VDDNSPPDVVFEGDSLEVIRRFPEEVRANLGADLRRVQNGIDRSTRSRWLRPYREFSNCATTIRMVGIDFWMRIWAVWFTCSPLSEENSQDADRKYQDRAEAFERFETEAGRTEIEESGVYSRSLDLNQEQANGQ
jgi:hypothetical protein